MKILFLSHVKLSLSLVVILVIGSSCARWGKPLELRLANGETTTLNEIINDLKDNDTKIRTLKGRGTFTLKTPQIDTIYQLHQSDIEFYYPDYLRAVGRKYTAVVLKLTCYKDEFLIELPTEKNYYYSKGGEFFEHSDTEVTPLDIFREMLFSGNWEKIKPQQIEISPIATAEQNQTVEIKIYSDTTHKFLQRKIIVQGKPWVILETERYSPSGALIAKTKRDNYRVSEDGVKFPSIIHCEFPQENAFMTIKLNKCSFNEPVKPYTTQLKKLIYQLEREKYTPLEKTNSNQERTKIG